jgi:hypothetical protein
MDKRERKFIRIDTSDLVEVRPINGLGPKTAITRDFSMMGVCFYSPIQWEHGQPLLMRYSVPGSLDDVMMNVRIVWSELIDENHGFLIGAQIGEIDTEGLDAFLRYYYKKVKDLSA